MKTCSHCHRVLPETEFYKLNTTADGLHSYCKDCIKKNSAQRYRRLKEAGAATFLHSAQQDRTTPDLATFTPRQLIQELRARGYKGELTYTQKIKI